MKVLLAYHHAQKSGHFHSIEFVTVHEYLFLLKALSKEMVCLGRKAMYYLAAAVSDFFLPLERMVCPVFLAPSLDERVKLTKGNYVVGT